MTRPALLQMCPLPHCHAANIPGDYRVLNAWEAPGLDTILKTGAQSIEVMITSVSIATPATLIDQLPNLKAICSFGVGFETIDVAYAQAQGIQVSNTPDVLNDCVADHAWSLLLTCARRVGQAERFVRAGQWAQGERFPRGVRVSGKRLGIVGLGRIGAAIAERGSGFQMEVHYHNRRERPGVPWQYEPSLVELARWADFLVIAAVGGEGTRGLINATVLNALGSKGMLINIARGSVVDQDALVQALLAGHIGAAGLDVFMDEPQVPQALLALDNVVLTPHIASSTEETLNAMTQLVLSNVEAFARTGKVLTPVVL